MVGIGLSKSALRGGWVDGWGRRYLVGRGCVMWYEREWVGERDVKEIIRGGGREPF